MQAKAPRCFISYSHDSDEHKAWVRDIATRLRADGVDVDKTNGFITDALTLEPENPALVLTAATVDVHRRAADRTLAGEKREQWLDVARRLIEGRQRYQAYVHAGEWISGEKANLFARRIIVAAGQNLPHTKDEFKAAMEVLGKCYLADKKHVHAALATRRFSETLPRNPQESEDATNWRMLLGK